MHDETPAVTCIGLANVDVIATADDDFMTRHGIARGASNILDAGTTGAILGRLQKPAFYPGGCAANTACGLAGFGIRTRFVGKTGEDTYADIFRQGFRPYDIAFRTRPFPHKMTSICLTFVTPDKDRSFAFCTDTAAWHITPADLPDVPPGPSEYIYLESNTGRMAVQGGRDLMIDAVEKYAENGNNIVINLNDRVIVEEVRPTLARLLERRDIAFFVGNIGEIRALFRTDDDGEALAAAAATGACFAVTNGPHGVDLVEQGRTTHIPALPVAESFIVNTIGAGDQFAAGFLAGLAQAYPAEEACHYGVAAAARIIQQISARPPFPRRATAQQA